MALFRVTIRRTQLLETLIEADTADDARSEAASGGGEDWTDATGGRGLGDDPEVLNVEDVSDEYSDDDEGDDEP